MKNVLKVLGIIALVAVMGFSFAACNSGDDGDDESGSGSPSTDQGKGPDNTKTVAGIAVKTEPTKKAYYTGDELNLAGLVIEVTYSDGIKEDVTTGFTTSGYNKDIAGSQTITVTCKGHTATFTVTVTVQPSVAKPTATPAGGFVATGSSVTLATTTDSAEIWYTTNGSAPAKNGSGSTKYTAAFTITPPVTVKAIAVKDGWKNSEVLEAVYGATIITVADISITAPAKNAIPETKAFNQPQERFDEGLITWSPADPLFKGGVVYTATITLTAHSGYTFAGLTSSTNVKVNGDNATIVGTPGNTLTLSRTFPATADKVVSAMAITAPPTKMSYAHGEKFATAGMTVTLTYDDGSSPLVVAAADFTANNIATDPGHDIPLERFSYNNVPVTVTYGNLTPATTTGKLTVAPVVITGNDSVSIGTIEAQTYTGNPITPALTVGFTSGTTRNMVLGTDFTVSYDVSGTPSNVNAGTATVTITGIGDYSGTKTATFTIDKADAVTTWPIASNIRLGQALSASELTGSQALGGGSFAWVNPDTVPTNTGELEYDVKYTLPDSVKDNYNTVANTKVKINVVEVGITEADVSITPPSKGATPQTTVLGDEPERFTYGSISWSPNPGSSFAGSTVYTASVTLTAKLGYTFTGLNDNNVRVNQEAATSVTHNNDGTLTLTYAFDATDTKAISNIEIKSGITNTTFTHGDVLDLTGLEVTLSYDDGSSEDVVLDDFEAKAITTAPINGRPLVRVTNDGHPVVISAGNETVSTNNLTVNAKSISGSDVTVDAIADHRYTGSAINPDINVYFTVETSERALSPATDYDVEYSSNLNAGNATGVVTGKGNYTGTRNVSFRITGIALTDGAIEITPHYSESYVYNGQPHELDVTVTFAGKTLVKGTDYSVTYLDEEGAATNINAGQATVTVTGLPPNYSGSTTYNFNIAKATPSITTNPTASSAVDGQPLSLSHLSGGSASVGGTFVWSDPTTVVSLGVSNYPVTFIPNDSTNYNNVTNISVQVAGIEVTITVVRVSFTPPATGADPEDTGVIGEEAERFLSAAVVWYTGSDTTTEFSGTSFAASQVYTATVTLVAKEGYTFTGTPNASITLNSTVVGSGNIDNRGNELVLTHTFAATADKAAKSFTITNPPAKLTGYTHGDPLDLDGLEVTLTYNDNTTEVVTFDKNDAHAFETAGFTASPAHAEELESTRDGGKPVTISYAGLPSKTTGDLSVAQGNVSAFNGIPAQGSIAAQTYDGQAKTVTISGLTYKGRNLVEGEAYTVSYNDSNGNPTNIKAGTATVTITGINDYTGTVTRTFTISAISFGANTVITIGNQPYVASADDLTFTVAHSGTSLTKGSNNDYTVAYKNLTTHAVGDTLTITITGYGNYSGTKDETFTVTKDIADSSITVEAIYTPGNGDDVEDDYVVTVKDGGTTLTENTHYTLGNVISGNPATVTITGAGNYFGTRSVEFDTAAGGGEEPGDGDGNGSSTPVSPVQSNMGMPPSFQKLLAK